MNQKLTDQNFENEVKNSDKLVMVDFFATWCEPCSMLAPVLEKVAQDLKEKVVLMKANLDDVPLVAGKFGVEKIPTVILFKSGCPISGFVGLAGEGSIKEWINNAENTNIPGESPKKDFAVPEQNINEVIERYANYAISQGFRLNSDQKTVERVVNGLFSNEKKYGKRYCPCRRVSGEEAEDTKKICPCAFHKEEVEKDGHCFCNLFVK